MRCCVFGGTGFIGSRVTALLASGGDREVVAIGRSKVPTRPVPATVKYVSGTYADESFVRRVLEGADEVIDLAYSTIPHTSFVDPVSDIVDNLPPTVVLLQIASELRVKKFVLVSSGGTVYGIARSLPIAEDHPTFPISPYGITKLAAEKYASMFRHIHGLPVAIARPGNAYGEGQRPLTGQGFVAEAIARILGGKAISLFGSEGTVRDYIHVDDVASGVVAVLEHGESGGCYNIGTGKGTSNREVLNALAPHAKRSGHGIDVRVLPPRKFDVPANVLDGSKLTGACGWRPAIEFGEGIERAWNAALRERSAPARAGARP